MINRLKPWAAASGFQRAGRACVGVALAVTVTIGAVPGANARIVPETQSEAPPASSMRSAFGSYMAGRLAGNHFDTRSAAEFFETVLGAEPNNEIVVAHAFLMQASEGNVELATQHARRLVSIQPGHRMAQTWLGVIAFRDGNFGDSIRHFQASGSGAVAELVAGLAKAWIALAEGDVHRALSTADVANRAEWANAFIALHRAMIADIGGKPDVARKYYKALMTLEPRNVRGTVAYASFLSRHGEKKSAQQILEQRLRQSEGDGNPVIRAVRDELEEKGLIKSVASTPAEGLSEVFFGLGEALANEGGVPIGTLYLQLALALKPNHAEAISTLAALYGQTRRYELALETLAKVPPGSSMMLVNEIRRASNLNALDRVDEAKSVLEALAEKTEGDIRPYDALASIMMSRKRFDEAIAYYTKVIELAGKPQKSHWAYWYSRGTCFERTKRWPQAERDLKKAMQLSKDQPLVLNYLGYSWVDQNKNLKTGLRLIQRAVELKPDDGHIVDSLGWAYYRLGNYTLAARHLERAVELKPDDPILNDHLGDALWRVGRKLEARYQWGLALSFKPAPEDEGKIREKLTRGLAAEPRRQNRRIANPSRRVPTRQSSVIPAQGNTN